MIEVNKSYYGPNDARRVVVAIDGDQCRVTSGLGRDEQTISVAEMEEWIKGSDRRIYYPQNYAERRIKLATGKAEQIGRIPQVGDDPETVWVRYRLAENFETITDVDEATWLAWRNALPQ